MRRKIVILLSAMMLSGCAGAPDVKPTPSLTPSPAIEQTPKMCIRDRVPALVSVLPERCSLRAMPLPGLKLKISSSFYSFPCFVSIIR